MEFLRNQCNVLGKCSCFILRLYPTHRKAKKYSLSAKRHLESQKLYRGPDLINFEKNPISQKITCQYLRKISKETILSKKF